MMKKCHCHIHRELQNMLKHHEKINAELLRLISHLNQRLSHLESRYKHLDV